MSGLCQDLDSIICYTKEMITKVYQTKVKKLSGSSYSEVFHKAFRIYTQIKKRSKRRVYIRSSYFNKSKIFLPLFWHHLQEKHYKDRIRRLKFFPCALELLKNSHYSPSSAENSDRKNEVLHRFAGISPENELFYVQVKENRKNEEKFLISIFPHGK